MRSCLFAALAAGILAADAPADWPQFRGPTGSGEVAKTNLPDEWAGDKNLAWKVAVPGQGWAQPVVVGDLVFVATAVSPNQPKPKNMMAGVMDPATTGKGAKPTDSTYSWELHALDRKTGLTKWKKAVSEGKPKHPVHPSNTFATETPCADGERVYAFFGMAGVVAAFTHAGEKVWSKDVGTYPFTAGFGTGSSPVLHDGKLFVQSFNEDSAFLLCFEAKTGKELWKAARAKGSAWSTPLVWKNSVRTEVVTAGNKSVISFDPASGKELWTMGGIDTSFSSSPVADGDVVYFGASSPGSKGNLAAVKAGAKGDITLKEGEKSNDFVLWYKTGTAPGMASMLAVGGRLYIQGSGKLICVDAKTGAKKYDERLPKTRGAEAACPFVVGDKLYLTDEGGQTFVVKAGDEFDHLTTNKLGADGEVFWASPAVTDAELFVRGTEYLYCVRKK
ncbi:MAG: PQQ-like beta-propeller repeat protein [Gemmataceae bacterium]|nr:PQQ-like beta-propeller repeat protein [Gemmataceae bacterium]